MKRIILFMIPVFIAIIAFSPSEKRIISGIVTDANKNPLAGVIITVKGEGTSTTSDVKGFYSIEVNNKNAKLIFRSVGFTSKEIAIKDKSVIDIKMMPSINRLEEVVLSGYDIVKDKEFKSSTAGVSRRRGRNYYKREII
jgi:hypothetical protein